MRNAMIDLDLERITVVYPGRDRYSIAPQIKVVPVGDLARAVTALFG